MNLLHGPAGDTEGVIDAIDAKFELLPGSVIDARSAAAIRIERPQGGFASRATDGTLFDPGRNSSSLLCNAVTGRLADNVVLDPLATLLELFFTDLFVR